VYRVAMLAWALWLALALLRWLRWGWTCFSEGGLWHPLSRRGLAAKGGEGAMGPGPQEEIDPRVVDELEVVDERMEPGGGNAKGPGRGAS